MGILRLEWIGPILFVILALSAFIAGAAVLADAITWIARTRRREPLDFAKLFRVWPLPMWILASGMLPDLPWRIAAGLMALEHAVLLFVGSERRAGRVIAGGIDENAPTL